MCVVATPLAQLVQARVVVLSDPAAPGVPWPSSRAASPLALLWLLLVWVWATGTARRVRLVAATAVLWLVLAGGTMLLLGAGWPLLLRECGATILQAVVALAWYRWRTGDDNLAPHRPRDLVALFWGCVVGTLVSAPVVLAATIGPEGGTAGLALASWIFLAGPFCFIGSACLLLLVQRLPRAEALATRPVDVVALVLATALALGTDLTFPDLPLSWLTLLPAVWAGLALGPWAAAAYSLATAVVVGLAQVLLVARGPDEVSFVPLLAAPMTAAFVLVALLLSLARDQRAHLGKEVARGRQDAVDRAELLRTVFGSIDEALVLLDSRGTVRLHNLAASVLLGDDRVQSEPRAWLRDPRPLPRRFSYTYLRDTDDPGRILSVHLAAVPYADGEGVVAVVRDVTTEHRRLEELSSFAAVAAHDLKSPLTAVQGWLELAEDVLVADPERAAHALGRGRASARRMAAEIDDWLAYTVAREGELHPERVPLAPLLRDLAATHPGADVEVDAEHAVVADPVLLRHLLANLVGNAVKYTRPGDPARVRVTSRVEDSGWVEVSVVDAGIGIPEGQELAVFEPFRRAPGVSAAYEGSGLGLALCKRIARRHGGSIRARRNDPGPGTEVLVLLPGERSGTA